MDSIGLLISIAAVACLLGFGLYLLIDGRRLRLPPHTAKFEYARNGIAVTLLVGPGASVKAEGVALAHDAHVSLEALIETMVSARSGFGPGGQRFRGKNGWEEPDLRAKLDRYFVYVKADAEFDSSPTLRGAGAYTAAVKGLIGSGEPMAVVRESKLDQPYPAIIVHEALHTLAGDPMHAVQDLWFGPNSIETHAKGLARSRL